MVVWDPDKIVEESFGSRPFGSQKNLKIDLHMSKIVNISRAGPFGIDNSDSVLKTQFFQSLDGIKWLVARRLQK